MRLIDADTLPIKFWFGRFFGVAEIDIVNAPTIDTELVKHGRWIKMSDADGIYYVCSECGNELPRVIDSFDPQFDLFPKLKCIDKTAYCPNCGAKINEDHDYEHAVEQLEHDMKFEPTYNPEDGSM